MNSRLWETWFLYLPCRVHKADAPAAPPQTHAGCWRKTRRAAASLRPGKRRPHTRVASPEPQSANERGLPTQGCLWSQAGLLAAPGALVQRSTACCVCAAGVRYGRRRGLGPATNSYRYPQPPPHADASRPPVARSPVWQLGTRTRRESRQEFRRTVGKEYGLWAATALDRLRKTPI